MKLGRVIPLVILDTCGDLWIRRSKTKVIMHYRRTSNQKNEYFDHNFSTAFMEFNGTWQSYSHGDPSYMWWLLHQKVKGQGHNALQKNFNHKFEHWPLLFTAFMDFNETGQSYSCGGIVLGAVVGSSVCSSTLTLVITRTVHFFNNQMGPKSVWHGYYPCSCTVLQSFGLDIIPVHCIAKK